MSLTRTSATVAVRLSTVLLCCSLAFCLATRGAARTKAPDEWPSVSIELEESPPVGPAAGASHDRLPDSSSSSVDVQPQRQRRRHRLANSGHVTGRQLTSSAAREDQSGDLEDLVQTLRVELKQSQATQVQTRSVINVLQEKQEAQERDLAIMKDDLARVRQDLEAERELVKALKAHAADVAWALADMKRSHDQVAADHVVLKRLQDVQNETMLVIEEVIMSNAVELVTHNKYAVAVRQDIARLQNEAADDRNHIRQLHEALQLHLATPHPTSTYNWDSREGNSVEVVDDPNYDNRPPHQFQTQELRSGDSGVDEHVVHSASPTSLNRTTATGIDEFHDGVGQSRTGRHEDSVQVRLAHSDAQLNQLKARVSELDRQVAQMLRYSPEGDTVAVGAQLLQEAFVNFTRQIYHLEDAWKQQAVYADRGGELVSTDERLRVLVDQLASLNASIVETRRKAEQDRGRTENTLASVSEIREMVGGWSERSHYLEMALVNASLDQCRRVNSELTADLRAAKLEEKLNELEREMTDQTSAIARAETGVAGVYEELSKHAETITSLSKLSKLVRHLPSDVDSLQADMFNFAAQLPADCSVAMSEETSLKDGVYLIRPGDGGLRTARVYCERDEVDGTGWTVIQRRVDGSEPFARSWDEYRTGFGEPRAEYWLGNDHLSRLTRPRSGGPQSFRLRIDMWDVQGRYWVAEYKSFRVRDGERLYRLELEDSSRQETRATASSERMFKGNATDALRYSDRQPFSAVDRDNDVSTTDCAKFYAAGWWYRHCHYANLNGRYTAGVVWFNEERDEWLQMRKTVMKVAPDKESTSDPQVHSQTAVSHHRRRSKAQKPMAEMSDSGTTDV